MLNVIAMRNTRRLWKDYLNYFLTLCMVTALMFAFNSLLFSKDIYEMIHYGNSSELSTAGAMLITFMSISTAAILIIVSWLINYMTSFILEKRSREFAIYLLSGMKKKQIASLYMKENFYLGIYALFAGLLLGGGLQQVLFFIFYKSIGQNVKAHMELSVGSILLTLILYFPQKYGILVLCLEH